MTLPHETPDVVEVQRVMYARSLRKFLRGPDTTPTAGTRPKGVRCAWDIIEPGNAFKSNYHVDAICDFLEAVTVGDIQNGLITMPPRMLKSIIISVVWPAWAWTHAPNLRWIFGAYVDRLPIRDAVKARAIIEHAWYQQRWGDKFQLSSDQNVKSYYTNDQGGHRYSVGVGGAATGEGADIIVADDPLNVRDAHSEVAREEALRWWREVMPSRLNDPPTGKRLVVMQRVHEADVAGWCIDAGYTHLNLPNEYDPKRHCIVPEINWEDPRTVDGQLLFPERFGPKQVAEAKDPAKGMGPNAYAGQYNQTPTPDDDSAMFPESNWSYYDDLPRNPDGSYRRPDDALVSWDMTFKGKNDAGGKRRKRGEPDYVVGQLWYRYGADHYLIDQVRGQWGLTDTVAQVKSFADRCDRQPFPPTRHVIEDKANGPGVLDLMRPVVPALVPFNPDPFGDKTSRAWIAQPLIAAQNVWLPAKARWIPGYVHEFKTFPNGKNDDQVDGTVQAILAFKQRRVWRAG